MDKLDAKDDGEYFSKIWKQLWDVEVEIRKTNSNEIPKKVKLFNCTNEYILPKCNENLVYDFKCNDKNDSKATHRHHDTVAAEEYVKESIQPYFELIGKLLLANMMTIRLNKACKCEQINNLLLDNILPMNMIKSIEGKSDLQKDVSSTIGSHVLPRVYQYFFLYGVEPNDTRYPLMHLYQDVLKLRYTYSSSCKPNKHRSLEEIMQEYSFVFDDDFDCKDAYGGDPSRNANQKMESKFRAAAQEDFITTRSWALDAIGNGLSMGCMFCFLFLFYF